MPTSIDEFEKALSQKCWDAMKKGRKYLLLPESAIIDGTTDCVSLSCGFGINLETFSGVHFDDALVSDLSDEEKSRVFAWIKRNCIPIRTVCHAHTSYGLKHLLEHDTGVYVTNNQFKNAMLIAGFKPESPERLNWHFRISKRPFSSFYRQRNSAEFKARYAQKG